MGVQLLVSLLGVLLASIWLFQQRWRREGYDPPLPRGSFGLPYVGETLHLMRAARMWEFFLAREKKYGPTFKTHLFGCPTVVVSPPAGPKLLFQNHNTLVVTTWPGPFKTLMGGKSLLFVQGKKAKSFRQILMAFLGPEASHRYVGRMCLIVQKQIEGKCGAGNQIKAYDLVKETLFMVVLDLFFSLDDVKEQQELLTPFQELLRGLLELPLNLPGTKFRKALLARRQIDAKLDEYLNRRRIELAEGKATSDQDLLSVLLNTTAEDGELMSDEEIKQNILMLVMAGHDTTSGSLVSSIKCIAENPWCYDELRKEHLAIAAAKRRGEALSYSDFRQMKYTWDVIQEAMRLVPPTNGFLRKSLVDFVLDGYTVPKDWQVFGSHFLSNKREDFFPEPEKFNPERFSGTGPPPYAYSPFGGGPRICPGYEQAKMQACVFLHHLILRYKWSLVDPNETLRMVPLLFPVKGLPIRLESWNNQVE